LVVPNPNGGLLSLLVFCAVCAATVPARGNALYDTWEKNTMPFYNMTITDIAYFDKDSALLYEPLIDTDGARIKISATSKGGEIFDIICFYGCNDSLKYEGSAGGALCWDCRFQDCMIWPFANYCTTCPDTGVSGVAPQIKPDFNAPVYHDIRDCAIPSGTKTNDDTGSFTYTDDCHYEK